MAGNRMPVMPNIQGSKRVNREGDNFTSEVYLKTSRELLTKKWHRVNYRHWGRNIYSPATSNEPPENTKITMRRVL